MPAMRVAVAGLGAIGRVVVQRLAAGIEGMELACAATRDEAKGSAWLSSQSVPCPLVPLTEFPPLCVFRDSARFTLAIENVPSDNPKTGRIVALSVIAALRKLNAPLRVGT